MKAKHLPDGADHNPEARCYELRDPAHRGQFFRRGEALEVRRAHGDTLQNKSGRGG